MNKLKLLYNVVQTMKEKEEISGVFNFTSTKNDTVFFQMDNQFSKNLTTGATSATVKTALDWEGQTFEHESTTRFTCPKGEAGHPHHWKRAEHLHHWRRGEHPYHEQGEEHPQANRSMFRAHLSALSFALDALNRTQVEEQPDQTFLVSLELDQLPERFQSMAARRFGQEEIPGHGIHHSFIKEFRALSQPRLSLLCKVNQNWEIEWLEGTLAGKQGGDLDQPADLQIKTTVTLSPGAR